jgi:dTDP-glucose 4,6-dehydratase
MIINAMSGRPLPVYGDGLHVRDWLHVDDHSRALECLLAEGRFGEVYNIGGNNEWKNIDVVKLILRELRKSETLISFVKDRPGHDKRYAIDATKIREELGWKPSFRFEDGLKETIRWYEENKEWWAHVMTGEYKEYYKVMYDQR